MQRFHIDVIKGSATYYELGKLQAEKFIQTPLYKTHSIRRARSEKQYTADLEQAKYFYEKFSPGLWQELEGVASAVDWSKEAVLHEYSGYQQDWIKSGCSSLMKDGFYARNYDYHPKTYEGRLILWRPEGGYASIGTSGRMIGRIDGMNEKGLVVGYHFVNRRNPAAGFICATVARFLLDSCANTEEAVAMLKQLPHRHAFNYSLYDAAGEAVVVEASGRGTAVRRAGIMACTNHFQTAGQLAENRYHLVESKERLQKLEQRQNTKMTPLEAYYYFNDPSHGIFKKNYGSWAGTIHTAVYVPKNLTMIFGAGENAQPVSIDFKEWLNSGNFPITKIFGKIDSHERFHHTNQ
ncbi:acyl-CoA--6-aminopenicillanic acid acyl-transferase [Jeotgalibacillus sp. S-D1]|uniref:C45 family autoproteolytic acyltransferase/hydolase n=1 Tax=Jeotgalibacillus sp. S-D1 TaxID=2552189 RepID=UPI0010597AE8|nr:C45 family peptidase [Jeotgalibacillus sp. S-D1]TDL34862.1 acyl-CoA--6-aminopenicillanic acid acyl-transferase [Jeotgalibacillus sp. S-D1]